MRGFWRYVWIRLTAAVALICLLNTSTDGGGGAYLFAEHFDIFTWWVEVLRYLAKGFELRLDEDE